MVRAIPGVSWCVRQIVLSLRYQKIKGLLRDLRPVKTINPLVRLGPAGDGGYLVPDALEGIVACFSPGVSNCSGFEKDVARRGIPVFMADGSVSGPAEQDELFHFMKVFIGSACTDGFVTISQWVQDCVGSRSGDLLLQMDIEGYEYDVLREASDLLIGKFRVVVVEFHELHAILRGSSTGFYRIHDAFRKLLLTHRCVHVHPNNVSGILRFRDLEVPDVMEFTFVRRELTRENEFVEVFPHQFDSPNVSGPELVLPRCWYGF
jgi:hypothetical protein